MARVFQSALNEVLATTGNPPALDLADHSPLALSFWIKYTAVGGGAGTQSLLAKGFGAIWPPEKTR